MAAILPPTTRNRLVERQHTTVEAHLALLDQDQDDSERWSAMRHLELSTKIDKMLDGQVWLIRTLVAAIASGSVLAAVAHWK